ncbi:MAG: hypothetical protein AAF959_22685 [Cyanobacteria bacterium P01_D01_bin.56]
MADPWFIAQDNFEDDDGSLPGILISNLDSKAVRTIYDYFCTPGTIETENPTIYVESKKDDIPLEEAGNAAQLVTSGDSHSFHCCFSGIHYASHQLPTLGLFVFTDSVEIDYRMGAHWNRANVNALFAFLAYLQALCPGCTHHRVCNN